MKLLFYELKKLSGARLAWLFIALLIAVNCGICFFRTEKSLSGQIPAALREALLTKYLTGREETDAEHAVLKELEELQKAQLNEAILTNNFNYTPVEIPSVYTDGTRWNDLQLFKSVYGRIAYCEGYQAQIQNVLNQAYHNLSEFKILGVPEKSFSVRYQRQVIALYENSLSQVRIGYETERGWGGYFRYENASVFAFASLLIVCAGIYTGEKKNGFLPVLFCTRGGRAKTAAAKLAASAAAGALISLLFSFSTLAVFAASSGLSSPFNAVQSIEYFQFFPYAFSIIEFFLVSVAIRAAVFALCGCVICALSLAICDYVLVYLAGAGIFGVSFALYFMPFVAKGSAVRSINLLSLAAMTPLFERYRAVSVFGFSVGFIDLNILILALISAPAFFTVIFLSLKGRSGEGAVKSLSVIPGRLLLAMRAKNKTARRRPRASFLRRPVLAGTLFGGEVKKAFFSVWIFVLALVLLAFSARSSRETLVEGNYRADTPYRTYMERLSGPLDDEKLLYIKEERTYINDVLSRKETSEKAYESGQMTTAEYIDYIKEYNYAAANHRFLERVELQRDYLINLREKTGITGYFLYDKGWNQYFFKDFNFYFYLLLILCLCACFSREYAKDGGAGFDAVLRQTKNGRGAVFGSKYAFAAVFAASAALLTDAFDLIFAAKSYSLPEMTAPLASLQSFSEVRGVTVAGWLLLRLCFKIFACVLLAWFLVSLSALFKRAIPAVSVFVLFTVVPHFAGYFGESFLQYADATRLYRVSDIFAAPAAGVPRGNFTGLFIAYFAAALSVGLLVFISRRRYVNSGG